jgi:hypothetical protein
MRILQENYFHLQNKNVIPKLHVRNARGKKREHASNPRE